MIKVNLITKIDKGITWTRYVWPPMALELTLSALILVVILIAV